MEHDTTEQASPPAPTILGYLVTPVEGGWWKADYQGPITESAIEAGVEKILVEPDLPRLRMRALINRVSAWAHEYEPGQ